MRPAGPQAVPGGREATGRLSAPSRLVMAHEEDQPSALSDNQVKACACGKPSAETWESRCQPLQTLLGPPLCAPAEGASLAPEMGGDAAGCRLPTKWSWLPGTS